MSDAEYTPTEGDIRTNANHAEAFLSALYIDNIDRHVKVTDEDWRTVRQAFAHIKAEAWDGAANLLELEGLADGGYADHLRGRNPYRADQSENPPQEGGEGENRG